MLCDRDRLNAYHNTHLRVIPRDSVEYIAQLPGLTDHNVIIQSPLDVASFLNTIERCMACRYSTHSK